MKSIHYVNDELLTGDDIADALVDLAASLARRGSSLAVDVPIQFAVGDVRDVNFLLGPASQIVAVPAPDTGFDELLRPEIVEQLRERAAERAGIHAVEFAPEDLNDLPADDEF